MIPDFSLVEGQYLRDILDQPRALDDTLAGLENSTALAGLASRANNNQFQRIVLTGMGSSFHALHPLSLDLLEQGFAPLMVETSELIHYMPQLLDPKTLIIAVSQSGQSAEIVRLIELNRKRAALIAVTNTVRSPLAENADALLLTAGGQEFSVSCKTYVAALMALKFLSGVLCRRNLERAHEHLAHAASAVAAYLSVWKDHVSDVSPKLAGTRHLFLVGRGPSLAAVGTGALIIKEAAHFHAEGMSSAAFRHGPLEMLSEEIFVLVFAGEDKTRELNVRLFEKIREQDGRAGLVGEDTSSSSAFMLPEIGNGLRSIMQILPVQIITLALAAQAAREPGRFELATKVTITE
jgi:glucosamine--fructose-6-phosphate aminotransferase (isomerizing)